MHFLSGYTIFQEFPEEDLLLLHTEDAEHRFPFSSLPIVRGMSVYPCEQKNNSVKVPKFPVSSSAKNTTTEEITLFSGTWRNLRKIPMGNFRNATLPSEEKLIGIVVATESSMLFSPSSRISSKDLTFLCKILKMSWHFHLPIGFVVA